MAQSYESLEDYIRKLKQQFTSGDGNKRNFGILPIIVIVFLLITSFSLFYTVEPTEEAVILRFGQYIRTDSPGLHFKFPLGIDKVIKLETKKIQREEFGFRTQNVGGRRTTYSGKRFDAESLILTGDLNVADVTWVVQYRISEPRKYLFHVRDPIANIRDVSEAIMRRVLGDRLVTDVLTTGRVAIADEAKVLMQEVLNKYNMGVKIVGVKLQDFKPPQSVEASWNEVNAAKQEQESLINDAEKKYNSIIPAARGNAEKSIQEALGYAEAKVNRAQGDASRFNSVLKAYLTAPDITRRRLYIDTMEELLKNFKQVTIVDSSIKGLLPIYGGFPPQQRTTQGSQK